MRRLNKIKYNILYSEITNEKMEKNNVNIVVFEEESVITDQSRVNYSTIRRATTNDAYASNNPQSVINTELSQLNQKINNLQQKADRLSQIVKSGNNNQTTSEINTSIHNQSMNSTQIQQLVRVIETKIQIVVQETKKIIERMTGDFDKKMNKTMMQKNHETNSIAKIQTHCRDTIVKIQHNYQEEINMIRNQHVHLEKRLIQRVQQMEADYKRKLKDFQNKQQEYIATIQHLENKLKLASKSQKVIELSQEKPSQPIKAQPIDNISNLSSQRFSSSNALPPNDVSKRRTRIFDSKGSNRSISPNNQVLSPLQSKNNSNNIKVETKSVASKPVNPQGSKHKLVLTGAPPMTNNFLSDTKQVYPQIKATVILPEQSTINNMPKLTKQDDKSKRSQQQNNLKQASEKQFFQNIPKPQWERFQDFNDQQSSGSEEDVFFYPQHTRQQPKSVFDHSNNSSMHSPFDLK